MDRSLFPQCEYFKKKQNLTWSFNDLISSSVNSIALEFARSALSDAWAFSAALRALSSYTEVKSNYDDRG